MSKIQYIVNNKDLTKRLRRLQLTNSQFAELVGYSTHAFKKWKSEEDTPIWVTYVVHYLELLKRDEDTASMLGLPCRTKSSINMKQTHKGGEND